MIRRGLKIVRYITAFIILAVLAGCEGVPEEHILAPGVNVEAAGCYCALRMKEGVIILKSDTPPDPEDCDEEIEKDKVVVFSGRLFVCAGTNGWKDNEQ